MKNKDVQVASGGVSFSGVLLIVFVVLKLCGVISWSWWWVLSPLWIPFALVALIGIPIFILSLIGHARVRSKRKRFRR